MLCDDEGILLSFLTDTLDDGQVIPPDAGASPANLARRLELALLSFTFYPHVLGKSGKTLERAEVADLIVDALRSKDDSRISLACKILLAIAIPLDDMQTESFIGQLRAIVESKTTFVRKLAKRVELTKNLISPVAAVWAFALATHQLARLFDIKVFRTLTSPTSGALFVEAFAFIAAMGVLGYTVYRVGQRLLALGVIEGAVVRIAVRGLLSLSFANLFGRKRVVLGTGALRVPTRDVERALGDLIASSNGVLTVLAKSQGEVDWLRIGLRRLHRARTALIREALYLLRAPDVSGVSRARIVDWLSRVDVGGAATRRVTALRLRSPRP